MGACVLVAGPVCGRGLTLSFFFCAGMLAIFSLVIVPLLAVFSLPLPFLNIFVPDSDSNARPRSKFLAVVEDSPCKSCEDQFGNNDGCQISDFAVMVDGAEIYCRKEKVK